MRLDTVGDHRFGRTAWVDARTGVAGDMLLGALLDAGADLTVVRRDVEAVLPDAVALTASQVRRGGMRATKVDVELLADDQPHRRWSEVRGLVERAKIPDRVRHHAVLAFGRLAEAEARVHGVDVADVHFHEVGAWDSIADVVGVCSALEDLEVGMLFVSDIALGDGFVRAAHGVVPVPVPAVLELVADGLVGVRGVPTPRPGGAPAGEVGELATPTGVALLVALADGGGGGMPPGEVAAVGVGAGTKDGLPWPNVVRVVLSGRPRPEARGADLALEHLVILAANVDDLDPRAWPSVLDGLLAAGARDAWLTPVLMKKGRPAHVVSALADDHEQDAVREYLFAATTTFGVRAEHVSRVALERSWLPLDVACAEAVGTVRIKLGHRDGRIVHATPEYEDAAALARAAQSPVADALAAASAAAHSAGLLPGAPHP